MASCSMGNRLQLKRDWGGRARLYFICAPQSEGFELFGCRDNTLAVLLTKLTNLLHLLLLKDYTWEMNRPPIRDRKTLKRTLVLHVSAMQFFNSPPVTAL